MTVAIVALAVAVALLAFVLFAILLRLDGLIEQETQRDDAGRIIGALNDIRRAVRPEDGVYRVIDGRLHSVPQKKRARTSR